MKKQIFTAAALFTCFVATPAFAAELDFRSSTFSAANNATSFNYAASDGVTVTVTPGPSGARIYQDSEDGFGVRYSYENDEIESVESLTISFSQTVLISDVFLTDLFVENPLLGRPYAEIGYYTTNGNTTQFHALANSPNGALTLEPEVWADAIVFSSPGWIGLQNHEFSVAGINYSTGTGTSQVPELDAGAAGTALLLLLGSALLLTDRRRNAVAV